MQNALFPSKSISIQYFSHFNRIYKRPNQYLQKYAILSFVKQLKEEKCIIFRTPETAQTIMLHFF